MIDRPIIVLGAPRSGTTILQRCLVVHPDVWHLRGESHAVLEGPFHPAAQGYASNRVESADADESVVRSLREQFYRQAINLNRLPVDPGRLLDASGLAGRIAQKAALGIAGSLTRIRKPGSIRLCEKTPKNTLRVPLLERVFPDALYIWLHRQPVPNVASLIGGWRSVDRIAGVERVRFAQAGYPIAKELRLKDYSGEHWKFALVPGWQNLRGRTLSDVAAWQYYQCNAHARQDLLRLDRRRVFPLQFEELVADPLGVMRQIWTWAELPRDETAESFVRRLPRVNSVPKNGMDSERGRLLDEARAALERLQIATSVEELAGTLFGGVPRPSVQATS